ncbi:hypothetical protein [Idiomarina zobellii]|uniref:DUF4760 domain-containing protein n=1 Tax=Idiomarina zobellii TaxID=86103 RepID=A0A837NHK6_9GAMM|nr:hypothetical protein [Idiomarina zobellii]KPD23765.1 hypothetical protein AFK76_07390 [Idiomarina zobellii]SDF87160.1 hypothetical protein SAMN04515658_1064 [Idiomarina zobellii]
MEDKTWIDYLTAIGSVATPLLVILLSAVGWKFKASVERKIDLENRLRDDRIEIYNQILEPFIILLMTDAAWAQDKRNKNKDKNEFAISKMLTLDYRKLGFKLSLMGADPVVKSYNNLMQYFYNMEEKKSAESPNFLKEMLILLGTFLLEIRKSMGNEATKLDHWDMCEWWMSDTRKIKDGIYNNV